MGRPAGFGAMAAALAAASVFFAPAAAFAGEAEAPFFVHDPAGVLSASDESEIEDVGRVIYEQTGCRLAVAAVDFLGGEAIEDYAAALYERNQMGDNGLLLTVSIAEENYHAIQGRGLEGRLPGERLSEMFGEGFEEAFAAGEYRSAIMGLHSDMALELEEIYSITSDRGLYERRLEQLRLQNERISREKRNYLLMFIAAAAVAVLFFARMTVSLIYRARRRKNAVRRGLR